MMSRQERFRNEGFYIERGALAPGEVHELLETLRGVHGTCKTDPRCIRNGKSLARPVLDIEGTFPDNPHKIWLLYVLEEIRLQFLELCYHERISGIVDELIGPDTHLLEAVAITKLPGVKSSFRGWHQDTEYFSRWMDERRLVTVLYYLTDMDEESGATAIVPGSHKDPLHARTEVHPQGEKSNATSSGYGQMQEQERWENDPRRLILDVQAGDVAFIDSNIVHRAGGNKSAECRHNIVYTFGNSELQGADVSKTDTDFNMFPVTKDGQPTRDSEMYRRLRDSFAESS